MIELEHHKLNEYPGNYDFYRKKKNRKSQENTNKKITVEKQISQLDHTSRKKAANEVKSRLRRLQDIEEEVEKTEARIEHTEKDINSYGRDYEKLLELYEQKKALQNKLDDLLKEWADLDAIQQVD